MEFELTEDHLALLREAIVRWKDVGYGAPGIDPKRPFGSSLGIIDDIAEILGLEEIAVDRDDRPVYDKEELDQALKTYNELDKALQIILSTQSFEVGVYERD